MERLLQPQRVRIWHKATWQNVASLKWKFHFDGTLSPMQSLIALYEGRLMHKHAICYCFEMRMLLLLQSKDACNDKCDNRTLIFSSIQAYSAEGALPFIKRAHFIWTDECVFTLYTGVACIFMGCSLDSRYCKQRFWLWKEKFGYQMLAVARVITSNI